MAELDQSVRGAWFEVRERLRRPRELFEHLCPDSATSRLPSLLGEVAAELDNAVEGGVLEVKRRRLTALYVELEEAEFSSEVFGRLPELARRAGAVLLVTALEHAYLAGDLVLREGDHEANQAPDQDDGAGATTGEEPDIKQIIADIQDIIAADPSAKMDAAIKNILLQLQKYRNEVETFRKLKEQATGHRLEMYSRTFAATFQSIFASIRKNYASYRTQLEGRRRDAQVSALTHMDTKPWVKAVTAQLQETTRIHATLTFLAGEHSDLREPLVALARRRGTAMQLLEHESTTGEACAGDRAAALRINRLLAVAIARYLRHLT